ncbi:MAG TPA: hypothetical protein VGW38_22715 [Chloroflexota bacterium]|nr:hypothetical protein [Chloroflexota bacterium]
MRWVFILSAALMLGCTVTEQGACDDVQAAVQELESEADGAPSDSPLARVLRDQARETILEHPECFTAEERAWATGGRDVESPSD